MKRKVLALIGFVAILVSIITISWNQKAYALENNESSVTTRFVDYDNLNSLEQILDEQGKELADTETLTGDIGTKYKTSPKNIEGYSLIVTPSNANGKFESTTQTVKYIYKAIDQSAILVVRFVDESGNEFSIPDLTNKGYTKAYKPEGLISVTDAEISKYTVELDYDGHIYQQGDTMSDVTIQAKIGDTYSLPDKIKLVIKDENGNQVNGLLAPQPDGSMSGIEHWRNDDVPANTSGTVMDKEVVVTYVIKGYGVAIPAP